MRLIILGAGGFGRTVADVASQSGRYETISFLDDGSSAPDVIGKCTDFESFKNDATEMLPAFGNSELRLMLGQRIEAAGIKLATIVHARAYVSPTATIMPGSIVLPMAVINTGCKICRSCIINIGAMIDHGTIVEEGCHICVGALVKAENRIPRMMKVEAGQVIENRQYPL
ncbi:MAG: hypothetical protein IKP58_14590 [Victivallales bacterium]|nr:hypothetical protein [Victivallales bacterium]